MPQGPSDVLAENSVYFSSESLYMYTQITHFLVGENMESGLQNLVDRLVRRSKGTLNLIVSFISSDWRLNTYSSSSFSPSQIDYGSHTCFFGQKSDERIPQLPLSQKFFGFGLNQTSSMNIVSIYKFLRGGIGITTCGIFSNVPDVKRSTKGAQRVSQSSCRKYNT